MLKSIYGEHDAQKLFANTVRRIAASQGFTESELEEGAYYKIVNGVPIVITSYVDDLWCFCLCADLLCETLFNFSKMLSSSMEHDFDFSGNCLRL